MTEIEKALRAMIELLREIRDLLAAMEGREDFPDVDVEPRDG
jgi:hypothetical protein